MSGRGSAGRELHLHVGLPKTGTSYLQKCLLANRALFSCHSFEMAPMQHPGHGAHHDLYLLEERGGPEALAAVLERAEGQRLIASTEFFSRMLRDRRRLEALAAEGWMTARLIPRVLRGGTPRRVGPERATCARCSCTSATARPAPPGSNRACG